MNVVSTSRGRVAAQISGHGPSLVLLHSLLADRTSFDAVVPQLAQSFRVIALDLPGFGESDAIDGDLNVWGGHLAEAVRALCPNEHPVLVGNGFGSFLAVAIGITEPNLASHIVLAGCGAAFSDQGREAFRIMARKTEEAGLEAIADIAMRRLYPPAMAAENPDAVAVRRERFLKTDSKVFRQACGMLAGLDLRDKVQELDIPVLASVGEWDEATPPAMAQELSNLVPNGRFELITECAHVPPLQAPEKFCAMVQEFTAAKAAA
ncbi:alpha/beta fold hydrolase [Microvirga sp. 0TCS3.31]